MQDITAQRVATIFDGRSPVGTPERLYLLSVRGLTQAQIGEACGVSPTAVYQVIHDRISSYNIASAIASMTGIPLSRLWPDGRYNTPPKRLRRTAA